MQSFACWQSCERSRLFVKIRAIRGSVFQTTGRLRSPSPWPISKCLLPEPLADGVLRGRCEEVDAGFGAAPRRLEDYCVASTI